MINSVLLALVLTCQAPAFVPVQVPVLIDCPAGTYTVAIPERPTITQTSTSVTFTWKSAGMVRPTAPTIPTLPGG